jgi:hypothetical protein
MRVLYRKRRESTGKRDYLVDELGQDGVLELSKRVAVVQQFQDDSTPVLLHRQGRGFTGFFVCDGGNANLTRVISNTSTRVARPSNAAAT